jgi:large subunit ribosomal protein L29
MTKKMMDELRGLSKEGLESKLVDLRAELAKERSLVASGTRPENPGKIRATRKMVARVLSVLNERMEVR